MKNNPKVVSFERTSAYLHHRALLNRRENNTIDALELMRHAVEKSPENQEYRLDLAELYCEMGCHAQSSRVLLDMLAEGNGPSECYYGLALNQLGMNDFSGAMKSLKMYQKNDPNGDLSREAAHLAAELVMYKAMNRPVSRKVYRAARIADRACEAMRADLPEKACRLFAQSLSIASEQYEMRALYAMALYTLGLPEEARRQANKAADGFPPSVRAMCVCAQVYALLGEDESAGEMLARAEKEYPSGAERRMMIYTYGELGMDERVAEHARLALQESPYDRTLLHTRAIALKRSGKPDAHAAKFWTRILRIDPDDSIARFYESTAQEGKLDGYTLEYGYQVPQEEYSRRLESLVSHVNQGFEHVKNIWHSDEEFRMLVNWAVNAEDSKLEKASMTVLATMENENARSMLRQIMFNSEISPEIKMHGAMLLRLRGADMEKYLPPDVHPSDDALLDGESMLACIPVGERQLVRYSCEVIEREYNITPISALTLMWLAYRRSRGTQTDPLIRVESASAALAYNYLLVHGHHPEPGAIAKAFGCPTRQMLFYARRIAACLDKKT